MNDLNRMHELLSRSRHELQGGRSLALALMLLLAALLAGCGQLPPLTEVSEEASATSAPTEAADCPADKMEISNVRWFRDSENAWRVVGMIENRWDQPVSKLVTEVEALDASGQVIDHGEDISAYPLNLQPGAQAPYIAWVKREFPGVDHFRVEADECVVAEQLERSHVTVSKDRLSRDEAGRAEVTGELSNPGSKPVLVNGLTAAVFDAAGVSVAAQDAAVSPRFLAPGEHGPFRVTLDVPPGDVKSIKDYRLYMDVVVTEPKPALIDAAQDLRVTSSYVDSKGEFHLTGQVTNHGSAPVTLGLQAAVYDGPGKAAVTDAANIDTDRPLAPGETRQLDIVDWGPAGMRGAKVEAPAPAQPVAELRVESFRSWAEAR